MPHVPFNKRRSLWIRFQLARADFTLPELNTPADIRSAIAWWSIYTATQVTLFILWGTGVLDAGDLEIFVAITAIAALTFAGPLVRAQENVQTLASSVAASFVCVAATLLAGTLLAGLCAGALVLMIWTAYRIARHTHRPFFPVLGLLFVAVVATPLHIALRCVDLHIFHNLKRLLPYAVADLHVKQEKLLERNLSV